MTTLATRATASEQMDELELPADDYAAILADLVRVNVWTLAHRPTLAFLERIASIGSKRLKLLDVGYGHGDMLRRIARWAARHDIEADLVGIDLNSRSAAIARAATPAGARISYRTGDYRDLAGEGWDAVVSSLVAHHMTTSELADFLRFMDDESRRGWLINDLHRHRLAHLFYPLLARAMGWHRIVREDGTLSIARAFRPAEWRAILADAGLGGAEIQHWFPYRLCVARIR